MQDCEIMNGTSHRYHYSLFALLTKIAEIENKYIKRFMREDEGMYILDGAMRGDECLQVWGSPVHTLYEAIHPAEINDRKGVVFKISKYEFGSHIYFKVTLNELGDVMDLRVDNAPLRDDDDYYLNFFSELELAFPLPFTIGDVVYEVGWENLPMVIKGLTNCGRQQIFFTNGAADVTDGMINACSEKVLWFDFYKQPLDDDTLALSERLKSKHSRYCKNRKNARHKSE